MWSAQVVVQSPFLADVDSSAHRAGVCGGRGLELALKTPERPFPGELQVPPSPPSRLFGSGRLLLGGLEGGNGLRELQRLEGTPKKCCCCC